MREEYKRISLDIDGVLAEFASAFCRRFNLLNPAEYDFSDPLFAEHFNSILPDREFWLNIPALTDYKDIPFMPCLYLSDRKIPVEWTQRWLSRHDYSVAPVEHVGLKSKVEIAKEYNIEVHIDDNYYNYLKFNNAGIDCYLFDAIYNRKYQVGKRIYSLKEFNSITTGK